MEQISKNNYPKSKESDLKNVIARRNKYLEKFFTDLNIPVRLIGDYNNPAIIYKEMICISAYVHNFNLHFTSIPFHGDTVYTVKLTKEINETRENILNIIHDNMHRTIFNIKLQKQDLYLAGYNFINTDKSVGRYPVFARHNYKVYFNREYAEQIVDTYIKDGYDLEMYCPALNSSENIKFEEYETGKVKEFSK